MTAPMDFLQFEKEEFCYLTTRGRVTGNPHQIEIWFVLHENKFYLLSGGMEKSDWVKNLLKDSNVTFRVKDQTLPAVAQLMPHGDEEQMVRMKMALKYEEWEGLGPSEWARTALVVEITPTLA